jgi:predicted nuclease of restriction endonuclease-like (RecB) superfamily
MIKLYWEIGRGILEKQEQEGWGAKIIDRLSADLKKEFPEMKGFSPRNLKYMRKFAEAWTDFEIVQEALAQITWYHNIALLEKLKNNKERLWYAAMAYENGWSRNILAFQIESELHNRKGKILNNFALTLPPEDSDMAKQIFKDPYLFDFLGTDEPRRESELEQKLIEHLQKFLIELGQGFAFVGRQVHLEVGDQDFYVDLLFYHLKLRCYVVVELKAGKFKPEHAAQVSMYLNLVDDLLRHPDDKPSIGLLLVREKNNIVVEYALRGHKKPIGVAQWERELTKSLPAELKPSLPTIEEIEKELAGELTDED